LNLGLSIGILVKSLIDDQTDSVKAQAAVFRTINEENDLIAAGLKKQIGTMETLAEKTELQGQIIGEIRRLERERNDSPELSWMQKKLGIADQTRGAYDAQITRLQTILTLSEEVADVDLMRKELAARVARNRDESDAIVATRKESEKNASVTNRKEALSRELARIQNETARASVKTRMAGGDESAEIAASVSGIDQQIAAVNTAIQDLQSELGRTEGSLDGLRDSNAQAFGTALEKVDDLKKAIPELQQELDSLQTQRMEEAFRATKTEIEKTGQALRDMVPQGLDSFTAAATAGARGDAATLARIGGAGVRMDAPVAIRRDMDSAPNVARQGEKDLITNTRETVKILQRVRDLIERQEAQGTYVPVFG
jgi:archaellum component FlaC